MLPLRATSLVLLLFLPQRAAAIATSRFLTGRVARGADVVADDVPACSCDCCDVITRRPDEIVNAVRVKCSPSHGHSSDKCGEQCSLQDQDPVLGGASQNGVFDYQRFCFFECKPGDGSWTHSPPGTQCVALEEEESKHMLDARGNAVDPATLFGQDYKLVRTALLLSTAQNRSKASAGAIAPAPAPRAAGTDDEPSPEVIGKIIEDVAKGRQQARDKKKLAQSSAQEALRLAMQFSKADPLGPIRRIEAAAERSQEAAERSRFVARKASQVARKAQRNGWEDALSAADVEVNRLRKEAEAKAKKDAIVPKHWREYAAEASAKASKKYLETVTQAQQVAQQWNLRASEAIEESQALSQKANEHKTNVEALVAAGDSEGAVSENMKVEYLEDRAKTLAESARAMRGTAEEAATIATKWYKTAEEAAGRAVAEMKFPPDTDKKYMP